MQLPLHQSLGFLCINLQNVNPSSPPKNRFSIVVIKMHLLCIRYPFCYNLISYNNVVSCTPYWHLLIRTRWLINLKPRRICLLGHQILANYLHSFTPRALWRSEWRAHLTPTGSVIHRLITSLYGLEASRRLTATMSKKPLTISDFWLNLIFPKVIKK
jgi:hypothetical protein